jgi:uncharacterized protein YggE
MRVLSCILAVSVLIVAGASLASAADNKCRCCEEEYPQVIVQGQGRLETLADKAYFNIAMRVEEKKLEKAFEVSSEKINSISEALVSFGVKKEDIQNLGYFYYPLYNGKRIFSSIERPTSYEVRYKLRVTVFDLDSLGKILLKLSEIPESSVSGLRYDSAKIETLRQQVLKLATSDARQKALNLAEGAGATLGKVMKIESAREISRSEEKRYEAEDAVGMGVAQKEVQAAAPQIEAGRLEITASCTVYYSLQ